MLLSSLLANNTNSVLFSTTLAYFQDIFFPFIGKKKSVSHVLARLLLISPVCTTPEKYVKLRAHPTFSLSPDP
jgi:hypothetical protein